MVIKEYQGIRNNAKLIQKLANSLGEELANFIEEASKLVAYSKKGEWADLVNNTMLKQLETMAKKAAFQAKDFTTLFNRLAVEKELESHFGSRVLVREVKKEANAKAPNYVKVARGPKLSNVSKIIKIYTQEDSVLDKNDLDTFSSKFHLVERKGRSPLLKMKTQKVFPKERVIELNTIEGLLLLEKV